ncbi:hypothetical protein Scep_022369 [Stephania cephalantha]|uniref:Transcription factor CBF/NF-Y/archaeal histone domain-containing protein n=2 Tax=Magnoliopsida TaxID=3398 RepID=A0AAP0I272_9MAGN
MELKWDLKFRLRFLKAGLLEWCTSENNRGSAVPRGILFTLVLKNAGSLSSPKADISVLDLLVTVDSCYVGFFVYGSVVSESKFINLISSESNEVCSREEKRTIAPEHVLKALEVLGFGEYIEEVYAAYEQHKLETLDLRKLASGLAKHSLSFSVLILLIYYTLWAISYPCESCQAEDMKLGHSSWDTHGAKLGVSLAGLRRFFPVTCIYGPNRATSVKDSDCEVSTCTIASSDLLTDYGWRSREKGKEAAIASPSSLSSSKQGDSTSAPTITMRDRDEVLEKAVEQVF